MSNNLSEIKTRIRKYVEFKGVSNRKFHIEINASDSFLKSNGGFNVDYLPVIRQKCPDLNIDWLLFNEGSMIITAANELNETRAEYKLAKECENCKMLVKEINCHMDHINTLKLSLNTLSQVVDSKGSSKAS